MKNKLKKSLLNSGASVAALAIAMGMTGAALAAGLPSHGHYVSGHGSIDKANRSLTVKQSSTTGIIDWKNFSVPKHDGVTFDNGSGATLNRVTGGSLSTVAGHLHASGTLYLMNSSGVIVTGTGRVVTGGSFVASSGDITNDAFDHDRLRITNGHASVINHGTITAGHGVRLVGGDVTNTGAIEASRIKFWAGRTIVIGGQVTAQRESGTGGKVIAHGHHIDVTGRIDASATQAKMDGGVVRISARGTTIIGGKIVAKGGVHGTGGFIETSGKHVHVADSAHISTLARHGTTGTWLIDPNDFTIAASGGDITGAALSSELASNDITIKSSDGGASGNGDIFVDDRVTWSSSHALTLDAYLNIDIESAVTITGGGGLVLIDADTSGTGINDGTPADGDYYFDGGNVAFTSGSGAGASLNINGATYTLLYSMSDVQNINASSTALQGDYALATSLDATSTSGWVPIGTNGAGTVGNSSNGFSGIFDGLGNTISNLTINMGSYNDAGLFGYSKGTIRDIGMIGGLVTGGSAVGGLVGRNIGTLGNSYVTGTVSGSGGSVGGLAGENEGSISNGYVTGTVSGGDNSVGGLVGYNYMGTISDSYATGAVGATRGTDVGGLVGYNSGGGAISNSYATGVVSDGGGGGSFVGGLVGYNSGGVSNSYATGAVSDSDSSYVGGLVGLNNGGTISDSYATGAVGGFNSVGALVGQNYLGTVSDSFWDTQTSGQSVGIGSDNNSQSVTGLNTAQLTSALPSGFSSTVWGNVKDQTTPYLLALTGNPQTVYIGADSSTAPFSLLFNIDQVQAINNGLSAKYALASDIDATATSGWNSGAGFVPLGNSTTKFTGTFDGLGNTVSNLFIDDATANYVGLFGYTSGSAIENVGLTNANVTGAAFASFFGALVGLNYGTITQSYATGAVTGGFQAGAGGLVGGNQGTISQSYAKATVTAGAQASAGGLVGENINGTITQSYATGAVTVGTQALAGGLVGVNYSTISQSYATGTVTGGSHVGGLVGYDVGGTYTNTYWNTDTSGIGSTQGIGNGANPSGITGLTTAALSSALPSGFSSSVWGNVGNQTTPYLLALTSNPQTVYVGDGSEGAFSLLFTMAQVQSINASGTTLQGNYALANSLDATSTTGWVPIGTNGASVLGNTGSGFSGIFDGLGNTISNLTINIGSNFYGALFGYSSGTIRDIGVVGGSVIGGGVGGLVGVNYGTISDSYASGTVSGSGGSNYVGGLVGENGGTISDSYATGAVSGNGNLIGGLAGDNNGGTISNSYATGAVSGSAGTYVGGLVGYNSGTIGNSYATGTVSGNSDVGGLVGYSQHSISDSYAMGAVSGSSNIGGLVGQNSSGTISDSYAIGVVSGSSNVGALVGQNYLGTVSDSFWDKQTSGQSAGIGNDNNSQAATGLTTAELQGALPGTFSNSAWGTSAGLFPYFLWQYPSGTPQAVSGFAYSDHGVTGVDAGSVSLLIDGTALGSVSTGANGYYYFLEDAGTISGSNVLTYRSGTAGAAFADNVTGSVSDLDIDNNYLNETTAGSSYATVVSDLAAAIGSNSTAQTIVSGLANQSIAYTGNATFNIDNAISLGSGTLVITANGAVNQTAAISAANLLLLGSADYTLDNAGNAFATVAGNTTGSLSLTSNEALTVGSVEGTDGLYVGGGASLTTTNGDITITQLLTADAHPLTLASAGAITESGSGAITASSLTGSSEGAVTLNGSNQIASLGAFTTGGGDFALTDASALDVTDAVNAGSGDVTLTTTGSSNALTIENAITGGTVTLTSADAISESGSGAIDASSLTGSSDGAVTLNGSNSITDLDDFSTGGNAFALTNNAALIVTGAVDAGTADVALTTTGSGSALTVEDTVTGGTVTLASADAIAESGSGAIDAATLTGSSDGAVILNGSNQIADLGAFTTGGGDFALTDASALDVTDAVNAGSGDVTLTTTGSGNALTIEDAITGGTVTLTSADAISESGSGAIDAGTLTGSSDGAVTLNGSNVIANLGAFTTGGNNAFSLTDTADLTTTGTVNAGTAKLTLKTTGASHAIAVHSKLEGGTVDLVSAATITENSSGDIDATNLTGSAHGAVSLTSSKNTVTDLGAFTTGGNNAFSLTDTADLTTTGTVNAGTAKLTLKTTGASHAIAVHSKLEGGTVDLVSAATITENSSGDIDATNLTGSAHGAVSLTSSKNTVTDLGAFTTGGNNAFSLTDDLALSVTGAVNAGTGTLSLTTVGKNHNLAVASAITGGTINLVTTGEATETSKASIVASKLLDVTAATGIKLTSKKNKIKKLGADKTKKGPNKVTL